MIGAPKSTIISAVSSRAYSAVTTTVAGAIGIFSPSRACFYRHGREVLRSYAAGELSGPNQNWNPRRKSGDAEIKRGSKLITARARDLGQNNSYVSGAINKICNNVVRRGIKPQARLRLPDGSPNKKVNKTLERLWARWARYADLSGRNYFASIQRLVLRHIWIDGEVLIHRVWDTSLRGVVPLRLEVIECDHLDTMVDGELENGNLARRGIELDPATGRAVAYHVLTQHPGDYLFRGSFGTSRRIPATEIIHVFESLRASQTRGISWLVAILIESHELGEYKSYEMIGAKLLSAFGFFVKSTMPDGGMGAGFGIPSGQLGPDGKPLADSPLPDYIQPGRIQRLPFGTEIQAAGNTRPGAQYEAFVRDSIRGMSTGSGMSYESFSNDYTAASYSSARSASLEERLSYQGQQAFLGEKFNDRVWGWFFEAAWMGGFLPEIRDYAVDPLPYHEAVSWQDPGWTWVDPLKDSKAADSGLNNATTTHNKISSQCGEDWEEDILEPLIREEEQLSKLYELRAKNQSLKKEEPSNAAVA